MFRSCLGLVRRTANAAHGHDPDPGPDPRLIHIMSDRTSEQSTQAHCRVGARFSSSGSSWLACTVAPAIVRHRPCSCAGYTVKKGQLLMASFWAMHRDEKVWQDADAFIPERWLDTSPKATEQRTHAWKAFGEQLCRLRQL